VLGRLLEQGMAAKPPGFVMETMSTRRINGDACAYRSGAPGIHFGMICDPMGHGLMAGVSGMPTIEVFNALAAKDLPLPGILAEINRKLLLLLPAGRFSCTILFRMDQHTGELTVLNAGMPAAFLLRADGSLMRFASSSIPLGIQADLGPVRIESAQMAQGDRFFACSDGLSELVSEEEILALLREGGAEEFSLLAHELVAERVHCLELADDVSWCLWPFEPKGADWALPAAPRHHEVPPEQSLHLRLSIHPGQLNYHELGPNVVGFLDRVGVPPETCQTLALLLSEAIVNAVEHGALGLGSALKDAGFEAFERERSSRLVTGSKGTIGVQIIVHHRPDGAFSHLNVLVSDPGLGFPWRQVLAEADGASARPYGRGLVLLKSLARDLAFNEKGNEVSFRLYAS
jgi:anti-sigma regulatory factor (Ser/Thr protein kinase)